MNFTVQLNDTENLMLNQATKASMFRTKTDYVRALIMNDHAKKQKAGIIKEQKNDR